MAGTHQYRCVILSPHTFPNPRSLATDRDNGGTLFGMFDLQSESTLGPWSVPTDMTDLLFNRLTYCLIWREGFPITPICRLWGGSAGRLSDQAL